MQADGGTSVLLTEVALERPLQSTVDRILHAYSLAAELDSAWAVRPLALLEHHGHPALLLYDPGATYLDDALRASPSLPARVRLAIASARALGGLHERQLIHRDIKPANIVAFRPLSAWLTGFGLTSRLPRYRQFPEPPDVIAGTLAYMAPEQTGRMNRSVDSRSDLYSLGVTLYQMFVGVLPFEANDAMGWVHCHIARLPVAPDLRRNELPAPLSAIILKLLAKTPEERYQTAAGLEADLRRVLTALEARGALEAFPLGARDVPARLLIPEKLYGREREVACCWRRLIGSSCKGTQLVLVSGYSGVGNRLSSTNCIRHLFLPADCSQQANSTNTSATSLRHSRSGIPRPHPADFERERQGDATGAPPFARRWARTRADGRSRPDLTLIIGEQPAVLCAAATGVSAPLSSDVSAIDRSLSPARPSAALFLDDLQWLDLQRWLSADLLTQGQSSTPCSCSVHIATTKSTRHIR